MVGVVRLDQEVGDGELQLVGPQPAGIIPWRQTQGVAQEQQDVGALGDQPAAGLQERRRERRHVRPLHQRHHRRDALAVGGRTARHVDIVGARRLQRQPHELAAPLDGGPVVELVSHARSPCARRPATP